jgi:hypothetical protein
MRAILATLAIVAMAWIAFALSGGEMQQVASGAAEAWQHVATPGKLSRSHAFLETSCDGCHKAVTGVEPARCVGCHADNRVLLQRQPTVFHASVETCAGCHLEHLGGERMPTRMEHSLFASLGQRQDVPKTGERGLDCATCHGTKDRHWGFLGSDCAQCHATSSWGIAAFRHPSPRSTECAQCHKEPPSHNMGHFTMMSARIAGRPHAKVEQCFLCHQTTSWNDIKDVGRIKHH